MSFMCFKIHVNSKSLISYKVRLGVTHLGEHTNKFNDNGSCVLCQIIENNL